MKLYELDWRNESAMQRLLHLSSGSLVPGSIAFPVDPRLRKGVIFDEWLKVLGCCNGFYCFESALYVFPSRSYGEHAGLVEWNSSELWRNTYGALDPGAIFFAEDIFGNQFGLTDQGICRFDAETAEIELFADTPEEWAYKIINDFNISTGFPIAHQWQRLYGTIAVGHRLLPKVPFVLGGGYTIKNLYAGNAVEGMRIRGHLATKLVGLPDGSQIEYRIID